MTETRVCARCGAPLGPATDGPICSACLIEGALAEHDRTVTEIFTAAGRTKGQTGRAPDRVGAYQVLSQLGEGGMGIVYLAEQAAPIRRRVALKLIKLGMDTRQVAARFDAERQALALMDHPNIASVFDAGATDDGRPFFVMEYVPGIPITDFCDRHQLSTRARLELFQQVCAAVQHAHQKGVIHRDLKPSNVLVMEQDGRAVPKVIDFGIAKATDRHLTERTIFTEHGLFVGTPEYMSPEQANGSGGDVDTRSDIYSLGMILYELLVGGLPFAPAQLRQAGYAEIQRIIREQEPPKPSTKLSSLGVTASEVAARRQTSLSTLARDLRGDLDWITLRAIEKDRSRRYASASELAADIGRHLHHEPVAAGPPRALYRVRKFVRKHRGAVAAWAALLVLLCTGLAVSATLYVRAERSRQDADRHRAIADSQRSTAQETSREADRQRQAAEAERATADRERRAAESERDEAVFQTYRSALLAADLSLRAGEVAQARQQLQEADPRFRGWEWRYLARLADSSLAASPPLSREVREVRFSRTGDAVLARGYDIFGGAARGVRGAAPPRPSELSVTRVSAVGRPSISRLKLGDRVIAISPDGTRVLSAGWNNTDYRAACQRTADAPPGAIVCQPGWSGPRALPPLSPEQRDRLVVRDTATGNDIATLMHPNLGVWTTARSPADQLVVGPGVRAWVNSVTVLGVPRQPLAMLSGQHPDVVGAVFSADGSRVATWSWDNIIYVWDIASKSTLSTLRGHRDGIRSVCFDTTASRIASASFDGTVRLWAVPNPTQVQELRMVGASTVACGPSGATVAVGTDAGFIQILDAGSGRATRVLNGHKTPIISLAFAPDSTRLASAAEDDRTARLWDVSTGAQLLSFTGHEKSLMSVAFRSDGNVIASGSQDGTVRFWSASGAGSTLTGHTDRIPAIGFTNLRGDMVSVSVDGTARVWDAASGRSNRLDLDRGQRSRLVPYFGLSMSPPRIAVPSPSSVVGEDGVRRMSSKILELPSGTTVMEVRHGELSQIGISPDGSRLAVATRTATGGMVRLWKIPADRPIATWNFDGVWPLGDAMAFAPDSRRLAVSTDARSPSAPETRRGRVMILEEQTSTPAAVIAVPFLPGHPVFLPDGSGLIYTDGPRIHIWDFQRRADVATIAGHEGLTSIVCVTPDGSRILTGGSDGTLRVWDSGRHQLLLTIRLRSPLSALAVSKDGTRIAAGLTNGLIEILDGGVARGFGKGRQ